MEEVWLLRLDWEGQGRKVESEDKCVQIVLLLYVDGLNRTSVVCIIYVCVFSVVV